MANDDGARWRVRQTVKGPYIVEGDGPLGEAAVAKVLKVSGARVYVATGRWVDGEQLRQERAQLLAAAPDLAAALHDLVGMIAADELMPESVSYMREARRALARLDESRADRELRQIARRRP